ncbi:MAG: hypothetical protein ACREK7_01540 [Gemmatimonadota bacterium]
MKRIGTLTWLAILAAAPVVRAQGLPDEITGDLEVTEHEAVIVSEGRIRLIHVSPQTRVNLDPLFDQMADQVRFMDGQRVTAIGELQGDVLWSAQVKTAAVEDPAPVVEGPGPELAEMTGVVQVAGGEATLDGGIRLIRVPPQTGVALGPLLARAAAEFAPLAGQKVRATGELDGDILWSAILESIEEEAEEPAPQGLEEATPPEGDEVPPEGAESPEAEPAEPY